MNTKLGYVADFCPVCADLRTCALERIDAGTVDPEYQRVCVGCKIAVRATPSHYVSIAAQPGPVAELQTATFPHLEQVHQARLALEAQVRADPHAVDASLRHPLLMEPLTLLAAHLAQLGVSPDRAYLDQTVLPLLRRALARLQPAREEIERALAELRAGGASLGQLITADDVLSPSLPVPPAQAVADPSAVRKGGPEKAALVFRLAAWLGVLMLLAGVISQAIVSGVGSALDDGFTIAFFALLVLCVMLCFVLPGAIERREGWARLVGFVVAALFLSFFPIGTVAGIFIMYCLVMRWGDPASRPPTLKT